MKVRILFIALAVLSLVACGKEKAEDAVVDVNTKDDVGVNVQTNINTTGVEEVDKLSNTPYVKSDGTVDTSGYEEITTNEEIFDLNKDTVYSIQPNSYHIAVGEQNVAAYVMVIDSDGQRLYAKNLSNDTTPYVDVDVPSDCRLIGSNAVVTQNHRPIEDSITEEAGELTTATDSSEVAEVVSMQESDQASGNAAEAVSIEESITE